MFRAQQLRHGDHLLHRVIGILDNAGAEKQAFDVIALVEFDGEENHFFRREAGARRVARNAVDAVAAIVDAVVGEQKLQQRDAAAIGRVAVADPHPVGIAQTAIHGRSIEPLLAQEASYFAASARTRSFA